MTRPEYRVPSMKSVARVKRNGLKMVSTFSGAGGSCLGFRMAGYEVVWASEFIEAARDTYAANFPHTTVDARDIREVQPSDILAATGLAVGELDVFEGSPPCASFSMAGSRQKHWGKEKSYSDTTQRADDLFWEFGRLLQGLQPRAFVAENVKGLVTGKAKGYFLDIKEMLDAAGYNVACRVVDAQWLGVPQHRERAIFVGVRKDIDRDPRAAYPTPLDYRYAIRDALEGCDPGDTSAVSLDGYAVGREWKKLRQGHASKRYFQLVRPDPRKPCPTITQTAKTIGAAGVTHPGEGRKFTVPELKRLCSFPDDFELTGTYMDQAERCGRAVPPLMMKAVAKAVAKEVFDVEA